MPFSIRIKRSPISRSLFSFQREGQAPRFRVPYFRWRKEQPIININGSKKHRGFMSLSVVLIFPGEPLAAKGNPYDFWCVQVPLPFYVRSRRSMGRFRKHHHGMAKTKRPFGADVYGPRIGG